MLKEQFPINQNVYLKKKMKFVFKMNIRTTTVTARFSLVLVEALSYRNDTSFLLLSFTSSTSCQTKTISSVSAHKPQMMIRLKLRLRQGRTKKSACLRFVAL